MNDSPTEITEEEKQFWKKENMYTKRVFSEKKHKVSVQAQHKQIKTPIQKTQKNNAKNLSLSPQAVLKKTTHQSIGAKWDKQLRKGTIKIEAVLDLHSETLHSAYNRLHIFFEKSMRQHKRALLIITGKGRDGKGVLRMNVPRWLNEPPLREKILTISPAARKDGGGGAFYVVLRKS